jgi:hypothetical protein
VRSLVVVALTERVEATLLRAEAVSSGAGCLPFEFAMHLLMGTVLSCGLAGVMR